MQSCVWVTVSHFFLSLNLSLPPSHFFSHTYFLSSDDFPISKYPSISLLPSSAVTAFLSLIVQPLSKARHQAAAPSQPPYQKAASKKNSPHSVAVVTELWWRGQLEMPHRLTSCYHRNQKERGDSTASPRLLMYMIHGFRGYRREYLAYYWLQLTLTLKRCKHRKRSLYTLTFIS